MVVPATPGISIKPSLADQLEQAAKDVATQMNNDQKFPALEDQLKVGSATYTSFSGVNDFDYPALSSGSNLPLTNLEKQLASVKRVPLPDELLEQFTHMQCNCVMGIFAEISRGWLAIDTDLYFWVYEDGSDVAYYDGLKELILAAGLITPKPGIFQDHIQFLLVITTPTNIYVLGVTFTEKNVAGHGQKYGTIHLHPEPLFTVATDNVYMTSIAGTENGRIFLAGKDGCIYELVYQPQSRWFSRKAYKVNHSSSKLSYFMPSFLSYAFSADDPVIQLAIDNTRGILYCRTGKGNIQIYDIGEDLSSMKLVSGITESSISYNAQYAARTIDRRNFEKIIHIAPVPKNDSSSIHLVAITEAGARLFFTTSPLNSLDTRPNQIKLVHVRVPPGYAPSAAPDKPEQVHSAFYRQGTTILTASLSEDVDALWCFSQDTYPFKSPIKETQASVKIDGHTWCLSEIPDYMNVTGSPHHLFASDQKEPPAIITQHIMPARRFVLLSAQGSHIITTLRPIEQLRMLLVHSGCGESEAIAAFFKLYGDEQACATCLTLICMTAEAEPEITQWATQAFFRYGGEPIQSATQPAATSATMDLLPTRTDPMASYLVGSPIQGGSSQGSFLATPMPVGHQRAIPTPAPPSLNSTMAPSVGVSDKDLKASGKHNGLVLYFSRIVKPVWAYPMAAEVVIDPKLSQISSRLTSDEISWFIRQLTKLKDFMNAYTNLQDLQSPAYMQRHSLIAHNDNVSQGAYLFEKASLHSFHQLLVLTIEALELWRILCNHQLQVIVGDAPDDIKEKLKFTALKDMFSPNGRELSGALINLLMSKYLHDNTAIDALSEQLRDICPTIYSADDALYTKANEVLIGATLVSSQSEKQKILQEAIQVYLKVPGLVDLKWTCEQLESSLYHDGIVDLCLSLALKRDPQGIALHFYKSGEPRGDTEGLEAFNLRQEAYTCILDALDRLLLATVVHPASPSIPTQPGPPPVVAEADGIPPEVAVKMFEKMLLTCLKSGDELFHVALYDWLISKDMTDRLLEVRSPYLEQYMVTTAGEQEPNNRPILDLLWKLYEKQKKYMSAAKVLMKLAERPGASLSIHERLEYLSRAVMSAKSSNITGASSEAEFLHEIEEKLDVARIQLKVFEQLLQVPPSANSKKEEGLAILNSKLLDISTLYGDYAEEFSLPECKLAIIHCASHSDPNLVERIWFELITKAFDDSRNMSPAGRMQLITSQLVGLGKIYSQHERYFPIYFLLMTLERKSCEQAWEQAWAFRTMEEMGVSFTTLFQEYSKLFRAKESCWSQLGKPLHLLSVSSLLFLRFLDQPPATHLERMTLTRAIAETTIAYLIELEAMDTSDPTVEMLLVSYKSIQSRLKRLL